MPITPIDLATIAPKSQETFITKQPEVQKPTTDHINANVQTEQKVQKQSDTVIMSQKGENPEYRYDAKDGSGNSASYSGGQKQQKNRKTTVRKLNMKKESDRVLILRYKLI